MILDEIVEVTKEIVEKKKNNLSLEDLKKELDIKFNHSENSNINSNINSFEKALKSEGMSFICEVKKASPSKGLICEDFDPLKIAKDYESAGASAISVLTEPKFFKGNDNYLFEIANSIDIPILRKDFVVDEYMIYEAKLLGASAILLIVSILDKKELKNFIELAYKLDLCPLVETHTKEELKIAIDAGAKIIGVNNRNLMDFSVDIENTIYIKKYLEKYMSDYKDNGIIFVSESGIKTPKDIKLLNDYDVDGVLIGESLMRSNDKKVAINDLKSLI
ncbi:indole-3-glycerol phosphate synthase TrpC [Methanobrevibacter sp. TMH8]|uniref:indole-3-glycerol phosphate synthase TrpC n=1 Tax=Methanobrevibacter sp. TMH8 TaxID=2848611 RepID=UPI001CCC5873|nr:indole-3-glycerol phosphate synthase TrpC [Methanobrevibacter sp. TMH8]MBZ9570612.1 indole-3-glycerol phosphate synthase TrpC [Methanobrevibacter sp. TMH8]